MNKKDMEDMNLYLTRMHSIRRKYQKGMLTEEEYESWIYYYYLLLGVTMESDGTLRACPMCNVPIKDSRAEHCWNCGYHIMIDNEFDEE